MTALSAQQAATLHEFVKFVYEEASSTVRVKGCPDAYDFDELALEFYDEEDLISAYVAFFNGADLPKRCAARVRDHLRCDTPHMPRLMSSLSKHGIDINVVKARADSVPM